jgi:hypothetical protein
MKTKRITAIILTAAALATAGLLRAQSPAPTPAPLPTPRMVPERTSFTFTPAETQALLASLAAQLSALGHPVPNVPGVMVQNGNFRIETSGSNAGKSYLTLGYVLSGT